MAASRSHKIHTSHYVTDTNFQQQPDYRSKSLPCHRSVQRFYRMFRINLFRHASVHIDIYFCCCCCFFKYKKESRFRVIARVAENKNLVQVWRHDRVAYQIQCNYVNTNLTGAEMFWLSAIVSVYSAYNC